MIAGGHFNHHVCLPQPAIYVTKTIMSSTRRLGYGDKLPTLPWYIFTPPLGALGPKTPRRYGLPSETPRSSFPTPRSAPVAGQRAAPPTHHVLHAETRALLVEADRVERPAVPADHIPVLLVRQIDDRLQEVHEPVRAADVLRRTAPGPVHEGRIFPVRITGSIGGNLSLGQGVEEAAKQ